MKSWRKLDKAVALAALGLLAAIALVLWRGDRVGVVILSSRPGDGSQAAATAPIVIEFAQRMDAASVQQHFSITPEVQGQFIWEGNTLYFLPAAPLPVGQEFTVSLAQGARGQLAHDLLADYRFSFTVRPAGFAFVRLAASGYSLWSMPSLETAPRQLSPRDGVFDFAVTPDGEQVVFSVVNEQSGIDLWVTGRAGGQARLLLDCGPDRCFAPDASPSGRIAYSRVLAPLSPAEPYGPPRVWLLDPETGETLRLHADTQKIGFGPTWSPDGRWLAYYDGIASRLVVLNIQNGQEVYLPSAAGVMGSWSPASDYMLFYDTISRDGQPVSQIYRAHFDTQDVLPFFDPQPADADYSGPVVSPDGQWVAIKVRALDDFASEQLWVLPADGSYALVAVEASGYLYSGYQWGSDSASLLYHRLQLGSADSQPSVWLWQRSTGASRLLAEEANQPAWLP